MGRESLLRAPQDPFGLSPEELGKLSWDDFKRLLRRAYELCREEVDDVFRADPSVKEVALCDGKVVLTSDEEGGITADVVRELMARYGKPCYIISRPDQVEEVAWVRLDDDYYPTVQLLLGGAEWADESVRRSGRRTTADFDTGNPGLTVIDEEICHGLVSPPTFYEVRLGHHLGLPYEFFIRQLKVGVEDIRGAFRCELLSCRLVRDWPESPLVLANPRREAFVGRHLMFIFNLKIILDPREKLSIVELLG